MAPRAISDAVSAALSPGHFFVAPPATLRLEFVASETIPWEVFRGHLLDSSRTRQRRTFAAWHVFLDDGASSLRAFDSPSAPRVSIRWDEAEQRLFVSRNILTQAWEAYEPQPGVIDSRPVRRWTPELIATIVVDHDLRPATGGRLTEQLEAALALAWTGVSRLPITSVEAPLPDFALGRMAYFRAARESSSPHDSARSLFTHAIANPAASGIVDDVASNAANDAASVAARQFEVALRTTDATELREWLSELGNDAASRSEPDATTLVPLIQTVFHHVSLTPYTQFADNLLLTIQRFAETNRLSTAAALDLIGHMIRHLVRHLTAYDLVRFHSFGANYPDALWLDALLKHWLTLARTSPHLVLRSADDDETTQADKRRRRRALRQAWFTRKAYEGHRVPDRPTSRGENVRVIPGHDGAVPEEQITQPGARRKQLYDGDPTDPLFAELASTSMLAESLADLVHPFELRELGAATFLDRPFGIFKAPGEVDRTPMLAYEAFSREVAGRRLEQIRNWLSSSQLDACRAIVALPNGLFDKPLDMLADRLAECAPAGFPASELPGESRPGIITLEDARVAAADFVFLRTVRSSYELLAATPLGLTADQATAIRTWAMSDVASLLIRTSDATAARAGQPWITRFERRGNRMTAVDRIGLAPSSRPEYAESLGVEFLTHGVCLTTCENAG